MVKQNRVCSFLMALTMALTIGGCSSQGQSLSSGETSAGVASSETMSSVASDAAPDVDGKYEPAITLRTAANAIVDAPAEMSMEDNPYYNGWIEELGIQVEYAFVAESGDYNTKLNMLLASNEMPDVCWVDAETFKTLLEDDMLADLTDVFDTYASDRTKEYYAQDGGLQAANVTVDGRIYGITSPVGYEDSIGLIAIRTDWMEELNLEAPKNMEDLWKIAKAFKEADLDGAGAVGISATKDVIGGNANNPIGQLLNGYGAYGDIWLEKDGSLVYGSIQPERRAGLEKLSEKFAEGLIDPEFGTKTMDNVWEDAAAGRTGIVLNDFCAPFRLLNAAKSGQEWGWFPLLNEEGDIAKVQVSASFSGALVVRKDYEHPEAAVKLLNFFTEHSVDDASVYNVNSVNNFSWPFNILGRINKNSVIHEDYVEYLDTGVMPEDPSLGNDLTNSIEQGEMYNKNNDMEGWIMWNVFGPDGTEKWVVASRDQNAYQVDKFTGAPTESMSISKSVLQTLEAEMITSVIQGAKPIEAFDEFVETWKNSGGNDMTAEVNEWYQNQKA